MAAAVAVGVAVSVAAGPAWAACANVEECLAKAQISRWSELADLMQRRADFLRQARQILALAQSKHDPAAIAEAQRIFAEAQADWSRGERLATFLTSGDYRSFLASRSDDLDRRRDAAVAELHRRTDVFAVLEKALQQQNDAAVKLMQQQADEEAAGRWTLGFDSVAAGLEGTAHLAGEVAETKTLAPAVKQALQKYAHLTIALPLGLAAHEASKGELIQATGELGLVALPMVTAIFVGGAQATLVGTAGPAAAGLVLTADLLDIARNHYEFSQAEAQQNQTLSVQARYRAGIQETGAQVALLKTEATRARDILGAQEAFAQRMAAIRQQAAAAP